MGTLLQILYLQLTQVLGTWCQVGAAGRNLELGRILGFKLSGLGAPRAPVCLPPDPARYGQASPEQQGLAVRPERGPRGRRCPHRGGGRELGL